MTLLDPPPGSHPKVNSTLFLAQERGFDLCPVCLDLVICDAILTECGHRFCFSCLSQLLKKGTYICPTCRATCLSSQTLACRLLYRDIKQFSCPGCSAKDLTLTEFDHHIRHECTVRTVQCTECSTWCPAKDLDRHLKVCSIYPGLGGTRSALSTTKS